MAYTPNIPQGTDTLSKSQGQMLANFQALESIFAFDHYTWDDATSGGTFQGFHKQITIPQVLGGDPGSVVSGVLYTKSFGTPIQAQLFFKNAANGLTPSVVTQLTGLLHTIAGDGSYTLPYGLILKWGTATSAAITGQVPYASPFLNTVFTVVATQTGLAAIVVDDITNLSHFTVTNTNAPLNYIAIGN
jgi:hypothetical protein